jgi:membrane-anchored protein YejM (alkaline phosphatase superfamily)
MILWTGLPPAATIAEAHGAATLWEVARAVGYRTLYVGSQNLRYEDFGLFLERAGIDVRVSALELGDVRSQQLGAPDERATAKLLELLGAIPDETPYFAVLHLSNTHAPYRVDPALQPFSPHSDAPLGNPVAFKNHYKNSVLLQERTLAAFLRDLRATPRWDDTAVLLVSDHGEQFYEHGSAYHLHSLFDEEIRVPGFLVAGPVALTGEQRANILSYARRRTYSQDVHATLLDVMGVLDARGALPFSALLTGRSLLRPSTGGDPIVTLSTGTGVWEPDVWVDGVMRGERLLVRARPAGWQCYRIDEHPSETVPLQAAACAPLEEAAESAFR